MKVLVTKELVAPAPGFYALMDAPIIYAETPTLTADPHLNRERVLLTILTPAAQLRGE